MAVTRTEAVAAALRVLEESGLDSLSLRRVAADLGVSAPTLYWHVRDKRELLDLVAEAVLLREAPLTEPRPGQEWWDWLRERNEAHYRALLTVRDSARLMAGNRPTVDSFGPLDRLLGVLAGHGVAPHDGMRMLLVLGAYTIGSVLERQAEAARAEERDGRPEAAPDWNPEEFPHLAAAVEGWRRGGPDPRDSDAIFLEGLDQLIAGMRQWHRDRTGVQVPD